MGTRSESNAIGERWERLRVMLVSAKYLIRRNSPVVLPFLVHFVCSHSRVQTLSMWMPRPILLLGLPTMHLLLKPQRWSSKLRREDDANGLPEPNVGRGRRRDVIILFGYGWSHGSGRCRAAICRRPLGLGGHRTCIWTGELRTHVWRHATLLDALRALGNNTSAFNNPVLVLHCKIVSWRSITRS